MYYENKFRPNNFFMLLWLVGFFWVIFLAAQNFTGHWYFIFRDFVVVFYSCRQCFPLPIKYISFADSKFLTKIKNISIDDKTGDRKSRWTAPLLIKKNRQTNKKAFLVETPWERRRISRAPWCPAAPTILAQPGSLSTAVAEYSQT